MRSVVYMTAHAADLRPFAGPHRNGGQIGTRFTRSNIDNAGDDTLVYLRPVERDERIETCKPPVVVVREESLNVRDTCDVT